MKKTLWMKLSLLVVMLLSAVSFTACVDDNEDVGMPFLELDIEELPLTDEGGVATFTVATNRPWTATLAEGSEWISLSKMQGEGTTEVELSVPATTYGRVGEVQFHLSNTYAVYETKTLVVKQGEVEEVEVIYSETVGTQSVSSPYPYVDEYTSWQTEGTGAATVTYSGKSATVRATGLANAGSGPNVIFFGTLPAYFTVNNITLQPQHQRLALSFLGSFSYKPEGSSEYDNSFNLDNFTVEISGDGQKWTKLACTKDNGDAEHPYWVAVESKFILKEVPEHLSIRFTAAFASAFRLDDIRVETFSGMAPEIDLSAGTEGGENPGGDDPTPTTDKIFYETFGDPVKEGSYWPYANENATNIMAGTGVVAGTTAYNGYSVTARSVGTYTSPTPPTSGAGHIWFPANKTADKNFFEVQKLVLGGEKNLDITFYLHGNTEPYKEGDIMLHLSADGTNWVAVSFATGTIAEAAESTWKVATASITLKESPEYLYMKFSSETTGGCRLDDPTIAKGNGGTEIDLAGGGSTPTPDPDPTPTPTPTGALSVKELVQLMIDGTAYTDKTVEGYVAAYGGSGTENVSQGTVILTDNDGAEYSGLAVYKYDLSSLGLKLGDKIQIKLTNAATGDYNGLRQLTGVANDDVTVLSSGTTINYKTLTGAQLNADYAKYMSVPVQVEKATPDAGSVGKTFASSLTFSDGTAFTVYNRSKWATGAEVTVVNTTATIRGVVSVYNATPQLVPVTKDDIAAFGEGGSTPTPDPTPDPDPTPTPDPEPTPTPGTGALLWHDDFSQFDGQSADGTTDIATTLTGSIEGFKDTYTGEKVYAAAGKVKLASSSKKGTLTTPALKASGTVDATMTVDLAAWKNADTGATDSTKIKILVNGGGTINGAASVDVTLSGTSTTYTYTLSGVSAATTITFQSATASKQRFYLDNLKIQQQ